MIISAERMRLSASLSLFSQITECNQSETDGSSVCVCVFSANQSGQFCASLKAEQLF